jgi:His-Xaa-Ser system protein HxsD
VTISINPKIYPLEVVHAAAYAVIDKAYVILDGDPAEEIFVELRPKNKKDMKDLEYKFSNELLNYAVYYNQAKMNKEVREAIVRRVFLTNIQPSEPCESEESQAEQLKSYEKIDDPLGIAKPWTPPKKVRK